LKVLCIYPGLNKLANDNAFTLIKLQDKGVSLSIIAGQSQGLKGSGRLSSYEDMDGVAVYRLFRNPLDIFLFPRSRLRKILQISEQFRPDLIFCSQELNMRLALILKEYLRVPILLLVEDAGRIFSGEAYSKVRLRPFMMRLLGIPTGKKFWNWLDMNASAIVTCHPRDQKLLDRMSETEKPLYYVPWPTHLPDGFQVPSSRETNRAVYVGSLFPFKNTQEFKSALPRILAETPTEEFFVVGPGPHARIVKQLEKKTQGKVKYIRQLSRINALKLIGSSYYGYTPVRAGGWGFIGDCWSVGTPVVMTHNDNYVTDFDNALVAEGEDMLIKRINQLYERPDLYDRLQRKGREESAKRSTEFVSSMMYGIFKRTIGGLSTGLEGQLNPDDGVSACECRQ
jgi:glycosyltransferase involved in cell wall biosynthesis